MTKRIDIKKVFYDKNPRIARIIPGFIYSYLKKIVHQEDLNDFLSVHGEKTGLEFVRAAIEDFGVTVETEGEKDLPSTGTYIFAANHPWGGFDAILLMDVLSRHYKEFKVLVNDILMNITNLHPLFIEINKHGKQGPSAAFKMDEAFRSEMQIVTFPSGFVSRVFKGQVMDMKWKKNFITKSVHYKRDIIPVFFTGRNSPFFYGLYRLRKFFGISANLEMLYLVDETYKHRNKGIKIIFGKPIPHTTFDNSRSPDQWAKWVKEQVYALGGVKNVPV
jgi:hypothetical protein